MKANKTLTLPKHLVALIERDARWSTYCQLKPVELQAVKYGDGRTGYIVTIRIGTCVYDLYTADIDLGVCETNLDLEIAFCNRVEGHLARFTDHIDLADWYVDKARREAMEYAVKCAKENPATGLDEAFADIEKETLSVRDTLARASNVFEEVRKFAALLKAHRDDPINN